MKYFIIVLLVGSLLLLLSARFLFFYAHATPPKMGESITLQTTLLTEPKVSGDQQSLSLFYKDIWRINVRTAKYPLFHYGDSFSLRGTIKTKIVKEMGIDKTIYSMDYPRIIHVSKSSNYFVRYAGFIRRSVSKIFHQYLPQPSDSLLMGIVFGINEGMPDSFLSVLRTGGVLHVIAASGMNVTMVAGSLFMLLGKFLRRQTAVLISIFGVVFYAVLSGLQPSILRASIMGILVFSASLVGRQNTALVTLGITAYLMLFWKPALLSDVGFQLSFFSTLGILLIKPLFTVVEARFGFLEDITTTIAAQIATLPILLLTFGQYGLLSVLVNALVLWTIPPLMILGSVAAISGLVTAPLAVPFLYLSLPFLWFFTWIVTFFGSYNLNLTVSFFPIAFAIGYYLLLLGILLFMQKRSARHP